jgi:RecB family exonuclease
MTAKFVVASPEENKFDLNLSVSKVKTFKDCPAKFRFQYIEKLPRKEWEHFAFGTFVHEVLESFHRALIDGSETPWPKLLSEFFKEALKNNKITEEGKKEAWDIINYYLKMITKQKEAGKLPNVIDVEKSFNISIDDKILLSGFIDRVQIDSDGITHVADYKTTKKKQYLKDMFQLLTYAFVLCLENPSLKKIRASYICLRHNFDYITKEFSRDEILKVEDSFVQYAETITSEKLYRPKPTRLCGYCDFLESCTEGRVYLAENDLIKFGKTEWTK